jgi:hypothetical protein
MADVTRGSIQLDDLTPLWRAQLFAQFARPLVDPNISAEELEYARATRYGIDFSELTLDRNLTCLTCHNSSWSVTDAPDSGQDRSWPVPAALERALFGHDDGVPVDQVYGLFRHADRVDDAAISPWGLAPECGQVASRRLVARRPAQTSFTLVEDLGRTGSVWDVETLFWEAVEGQRGQALAIGEDREVTGRAALAFLWGTSVVNRTWEQAFGARLTLPHGLPRNQGQRDRLWALTDGFLEDGYSLRELVVAVASDPLFNAGDPATDFQLLSALEQAWGSCSPPASPGQWDGLVSTPGLAGCTGCTCEPEVCAEDTYCCEVQWDDHCAGACEYSSLGGESAETAPDFIARLVAQVGTFDEAVAALRDRLLGDPTLPDDEAAAVRALTGIEPDTPLAPDHEQALRLICGSWLVSPEVLLSMLPAAGGESDEAPRLDLDVAEDCERVDRALAGADAAVTCAEFR